MQVNPSDQASGSVENSDMDVEKFAETSSMDVFTKSDFPICVIVLGMAGAGKTSFVRGLNAYLNSKNCPPYLVNLDPACRKIPYNAHIDIRNTVNYKEIMKEYSLGPNGGIMTSLNLFSTRFEKVMELLKKRSHQYRYAIFDTPGQIEVFTWSASGTIICEALASGFPTLVVYVMDTVRSASPVTFMSNMLYACSILYKSKLPFIIAMNKTDIVDHKFAVDWMRNFETFLDALQFETSHISNLSRSMSLVLDEFYSNLTAVGVSSETGKGMDEVLKAIDVAAEEYHTLYRPEYERLKKEKDDAKKTEMEEQFRQLELDTGEGENVPVEPSASLNRHGSDIYIHRGSDDDDTSDDDEREKIVDDHDLE